MGDGNRNNNNWANMLGLAVGAAVAAGAGYLAYNAAQQLLPEQPERERNGPRSQRQRQEPDPRNNWRYFNDRPTSSSERDMREKHRAAAPYYFFLSSVTDSRNTHSEPLSLRFTDILDPSLGDLESSLQMNCVMDYDWLMAQYHAANQGAKPITLLYTEMNDTNIDEFVTAVKVKVPSCRSGSHHTKMCVLAYTDGSMRVCVHTANLVECEWDNCVQGIWLSPLCPALPLDADSDEGESQTNFKNDLTQYLSAYRLSQLQPWIKKLYRVDFSNIKVFFVGSIPGSHNGMNSDKWGHAKLASLLNQHVQIKPKRGCPPSSWQIIAQCSNIGGLGPNPTSPFYSQMKQAMSEGLDLPLEDAPPISVIYPSYKNVAASYDGLHGGSRLLYSRSLHAQQRWIQHHLFGWKCSSRHRSKAMPHIKTYACVSPDHSELAWFHLTSCNLTQAAWGKKNGGSIKISNYEAGVLFLPKFLIRSSNFPIKEQPGYVPVFPMPYDLPLNCYTYRDKPWFEEDRP